MPSRLYWKAYGVTGAANGASSAARTSSAGTCSSKTAAAACAPEASENSTAGTVHTGTSPATAALTASAWSSGQPVTNTPSTVVQALVTIAVQASTVALTCSGVRSMAHTARNTGEARSAATSALNEKLSGSLTAERSVPTITIASGAVAATASEYAATMSGRAPSLSSRARRGHTPVACSRVMPEVAAPSNTSVKVSRLQTAGRNTPVFLAVARARTTP